MKPAKIVQFSELDILISELEAYEKSLNFNLAGYTQKLADGEEHFCCKVCGHSPFLLLQRLKHIRDNKEPRKRKKTKEES